jgi:hypothetical protein
MRELGSSRLRVGWLPTAHALCMFGAGAMALAGTVDDRVDGDMRGSDGIGSS